MHGRMRMIQKRDAACSRGDGRRCRPMHAPATGVFDEVACDLLHRLHGLGIATSAIAYHVTDRTLRHESGERLGRDCETMTGPGDDHAKDILNPGGATLAHVVGEETATRWIVPSLEAFHEDESPQMMSCARDLASEPRSAEMHPPARFRPATAVPIRCSARSAGLSRCALVTQVFTAEFDNAVH